MNTTEKPTQSLNLDHDPLQPSELSSPPTLPTSNPPTRKPRPVLLGIMALVAVVAAYKGYGAYTFGQTHVNTDNAYVTGDLVGISPTVAGTLAELNVSDGDFVKKGQLIARLDTDSYRAALAQAKANLKAAEAQVPQAEAEVEFTKLSTDAAIKSSQAGIATQSARTEGSRMQVRLSSDTVHNQIQQAQSQVEQSQALVAQAKGGVGEAQAALAGAKLAVQSAEQNARAALSSELSAKAEATRAQKDLLRYQTLFSQQAVSQQQLDAAIASASTSQANDDAMSQKAAAATSQVQSAKSAVEQAQSRLEEAKSQLQAAQKAVQVAQSGLGLAQASATQVGIQHANVQTNEGQGGQATASLASAQAGVQQITLREKQLAAARAQLLQAQAAVDQASIQVQDAYLYAPCDGYVVKHTANVGTAINPGQTIVTITRGKTVWVMANFKETQLDHVREGQAVTMDVDAYPGREFKGKVLKLLQATGAATTLLPPDNSTGNFTKVVQRVPIKISIEPESSNGPELRQGMSVDVTIDTAGAKE